MDPTVVCKRCYALVDTETATVLAPYNCDHDVTPFASEPCKVKELKDMDPVSYVKKNDPDLYKKVTDKAPYDAVENPPHYAQYQIQPIEFIMANRLGYCEGNVVKYISRWRMKDGVQDLEKAREYINILIEEEERNASEVEDC